jgi:hypothetical protein
MRRAIAAEIDHSTVLPAPVGVGRVLIVIFLSELIALAANNKDHANRHESWRNDEDQNSAAQGLNHANARGSGLGIAQGAALGEGWGRAEHGQSHKRNPDQQDWLAEPELVS